MDQVEQKFILKLGKRIAQLRREQRYTQVELSSRINMEEAALRRVELGGTNPTVKTLLKIASGLEIPLKNFLTFKNNHLDINSSM